MITDNSIGLEPSDGESRSKSKHRAENSSPWLYPYNQTIGTRKKETAGGSRNLGYKDKSKKNSFLENKRNLIMLFCHENFRFIFLFSTSIDVIKFSHVVNCASSY